MRILHKTFEITPLSHNRHRVDALYSWEEDGHVLVDRDTPLFIATVDTESEAQRICEQLNGALQGLPLDNHYIPIPKSELCPRGKYEGLTEEERWERFRNALWTSAV
jgi:hypothetical protein